MNQKKSLSDFIKIDDNLLRFGREDGVDDDDDNVKDDKQDVELNLNILSICV